MTFPLTHREPNSLYWNLALSAQVLPRSQRSIAALSVVDQLRELTGLHPGDFRDYRRCVAVLTPPNEEADDFGRGEGSVSAEQRRSIGGQSKGVAVNLRDALALERPLPSLSPVLRCIDQLMAITHLRSPPPEEWEEVLDRHYPKDQRDRNEVMTLTKFAVDYWGLEFVPQEDLRALMLEQEGKVRWREIVYAVREICRRAVFDRLNRAGGGHQPSPQQLNSWQSALYAEWIIEGDLRGMFSRFTRAFSTAEIYSASQLRLGDQFEDNRLRYDRWLRNLASDERAVADRAQRSLQSAIDLSLTRCALKYGIEYHPALIRREMRALDQLAIAIQLQLQVNQEGRSNWSSLSRVLIERLALYKWCLEIWHQVSCALEHCYATADQLHLPVEAKRELTPAMFAIYHHFGESWMAALKRGVSFGLCDRLLKELIKVRGLLCEVSSTRQNLYDQINALWPVPPTLAGNCQGALARRSNRLRTLSEALLPDTLPEISIDHPDAPLVANSSELPAGLSSGGDRNFGTRAPSRGVRQFRINGNLSYYPRVFRWFRAQIPLAHDNFPEYQNAPLPLQELLLRLNRLLPLADQFAHGGYRMVGATRGGHVYQRLIIPGQLHSRFGVQEGIVAWALDERGRCFNRFFHAAFEGEGHILSAVKRGLNAAQNCAMHAQLHRDGRVRRGVWTDEGEGVEFNAALGMVTLTSARIDDLVLKLFLL